MRDPINPNARAEERECSTSARRRGRRRFLQMAGGVAGGALFIAGCDSDDPVVEDPPDVVLDFSSDTDVLNYAYALEQLEAAFYAQVAANFYSGITAGEQAVLEDLMAHEDIHRLTLQAALGTNAIPDLTPDFSSIDFSSRASVLGTAQVFEDLGVSAYNGAARFLSNAAFLAAAGEIVSVEARHAAAIRDLMDPSQNFFGGEFVIDSAYVIDGNGLDEARTPSEVLQAASGFIMETIEIRNAG